MSVAEPVSPKPMTLKDPALNEVLQRLRQTDNVTNFFYLARTWAFLVVAIGGAVWFHQYQQATGLSAWWNVPIFAFAILFIGAGQHQLTGLAHEASHHILFRNRYLNDLVSDWFCMFPMFSCTHHYRLQHLAHHQFVNDPVRDPDVSQLQTSGHWLDFPLSKQAFLKTLVKQLWLPNLVKYIRIRAKYNSVGTDKNPYLKKGWKPNKIPVLAGIAYILGQIALLTGLVMHGDPVLLALLPALAWAGMMLFYASIPGDWYHQSRVHPVIPSRAMTLMRITFITSLFTGLAWTTFLTGQWAAMYFFLLWVAPMFTSFSFFMVLRQLVQHGNGGRGWLTNTRVFFVHPLINFSVFPMGQDLHLPHHMYATVPHYRLRELHEQLLRFAEYREHATVVEGYFLPKHLPPRPPTVLEVLGPEFASVAPNEVFIDNTVLEDDDVEEKQAILQEGMQEAARLVGSP